MPLKQGVQHDSLDIIVNPQGAMHMGLNVVVEQVEAAAVLDGHVDQRHSLTNTEVLGLHVAVGVAKGRPAQDFVV